MKALAIAEALTDRDINRFFDLILGISCSVRGPGPIAGWLIEEIDLFLPEMPEPTVGDFRRCMSHVSEFVDGETSKERIANLFLTTIATYYHSVFTSRVRGRCQGANNEQDLMRVRFRPIPSQKSTRPALN